MQKKKKITGKEKRGLSRRRFIGGSIAAIAGTGLQGSKNLFSSESNPGEGDLKIKEYRTLGRTGFKVSDIGFGSGELADGALLEAILDSGVNYIDSAENYGRGRSERVIGSVIKKRDRKKIFITTKLGVRKDDTKESIIKRAEKCLERLQTDYIDCLMTHMPATVVDLKNKVFLDAVKELKSRDKVRFCGVSNHGSQWNDVPETMDDLYCRHACGVCESECPEQVPVNTIMRYNYYFTTQGREKSAMQKYASLPSSRADSCKDCAGYCEKACPFGVPVQGLLGLAHQTLTLI